MTFAASQEQRRLRTEEDKRKKALEIERKKAAAQAAMSGGRNFVIDREKNAGDGTMDKAGLQGLHLYTACEYLDGPGW